MILCRAKLADFNAETTHPPSSFFKTERKINKDVENDKWRKW